MKPFLSIVVPAYNVEKYLDRCIKSLLTQELNTDEFEIIIVNDGSRDRSLNIATSYARNVPNIKVIDQKNKGLGRARNAGFQLASGKYLHFVDSDDYIAQNVYKTLLRAAIVNDLDMLIFKQKITYSNGESFNSDDKFEPKLGPIMTGIDYISSQGYITTSTISLIKTEFLLREKIFFPTGLFEDTNFISSLISSARRIAFLPIDVYRYQVNNTGSIMNKTDAFHLKRAIVSLKYVILRFSRLIEIKKEEGIANVQYFQTLKKLQSKACVSLMIYLIKAKSSTAAIDRILPELKEYGAYPIYFGSDQKIKIKQQVYKFIFNNKAIYKYCAKLYACLRKFSN